MGKIEMDIFSLPRLVNVSYANEPGTMSVDAQTGLKRNAISAAGIVFLLLSALSPLIGLTGGIPSAMVLGNGTGAPSMFLLAGAQILLFCVGYVAMSRHVTNAGALYAYVGRGFGLQFGLGAASLALWTYTTVQLGVYAFFGVVAGGLLHEEFGWQLPWWSLSLILIAIVQVFGVLHIEFGTRFLALLMSLEWGSMFLLGLVIFVKGGAGEGLAVANIMNPSVVSSGAPGVAFLFCFASMFGFEAGALYSEEVRDPQRSVARATYSSVVLVMLFFLFTSWMLIVGYGPSHAVAMAQRSLASGNPASYLFDAGARYLGPWAPRAMNIFVLTSMVASSLAFHNSISRYLYSLGRDSVLPQVLQKTNRAGAPFIASSVQTLSMIVLLLPFILSAQDPMRTLFFWGTGISVIGIVTLYILSSCATVRFFRCNRALDSRYWHTLFAPSLSALSLVATLVLIVHNFATLVGGSTERSAVLTLTVPGSFLIGFAGCRFILNRRSAEVLTGLKSELT